MLLRLRQVLSKEPVNLVFSLLFIANLAYAESTGSEMSVQEKPIPKALPVEEISLEFPEFVNIPKAIPVEDDIPTAIPVFENIPKAIPVEDDPIVVKETPAVSPRTTVLKPVLSPEVQAWLVESQKRDKEREERNAIVMQATGGPILAYILYVAVRYGIDTYTENSLKKMSYTDQLAIARDLYLKNKSAPLSSRQQLQADTLMRLDHNLEAFSESEKLLTDWKQATQENRPLENESWNSYLSPDDEAALKKYSDTGFEKLNGRELLDLLAIRQTQTAPIYANRGTEGRGMPRVIDNTGWADRRHFAEINRTDRVVDRTGTANRSRDTVGFDPRFEVAPSSRYDSARESAGEGEIVPVDDSDVELGEVVKQDNHSRQDIVISGPRVERQTEVQRPTWPRALNILYPLPADTNRDRNNVLARTLAGDFDYLDFRPRSPTIDQKKELAQLKRDIESRKERLAQLEKNLAPQAKRTLAQDIQNLQKQYDEHWARFNFEKNPLTQEKVEELRKNQRDIDEAYTRLKNLESFMKASDMEKMWVEHFDKVVAHRESAESLGIHGEIHFTDNEMKLPAGELMARLAREHNLFTEDYELLRTNISQRARSARSTVINCRAALLVP